MAKEDVDKNNKDKSGPKSKEKALTKVVVRRLPPLMTEDVFLEQIAPLADNDYFHFVKADMSLGIFAFSRAYINFLNVDDLFIFRDKFDGYVFLDNKGNEYVAVVEFATSQKIPRKTSETDPKCGTIEQDAEYVQVLKALESPEPIHLPSAESFLEEIEARERERRAQNDAIVSTPLVEFLKQKKVERTRLRDERREEKRRKDLERRRQRDEERFKRRNEKKEDNNKPVVLQLLKNPDRDKDKDKEEPSTSSKTNEQRLPSRKEPTEKKEVREKPPKERNTNSVKFRDKRERETNKKPVRKEGKDERPVKKSSEGSVVEEKSKEKPKKLDKDLKPKRIEEREEPPIRNKSEVAKSKEEGQEVTPPSEKSLSTPKHEESTVGEAEKEKKRDEVEDRKSKADHKVRNKDRPAMQIYQPRHRLAMKDGSSTPGGGSGATSPGPPTTQGAGSQVTSQAEEAEAEKKQEMRTRTFKRTSVQKE
nr:EOG090X04G9 [Triops cancriformis]